jgi:hypothetical protein
MADDPPKRVMPLRFRLARPAQPPAKTPIHELYAQMQARILELEKALAEIPAKPGMGHNRPPEPLEIDPADIDELNYAVQVLREQPVSPPNKGEVALNAVTVIEAKASRLRAWAERRGEEFASEATKAAGKQTGTWLTGAFVLWLVDRMLDLSHIVHAWLKALAVQ